MRIHGSEDKCVPFKAFMKRQAPSQPEASVVVLGGPDLSQSCL